MGFPLCKEAEDKRSCHRPGAADLAEKAVLIATEKRGEGKSQHPCNLSELSLYELTVKSAWSLFLLFKGK